MFQYTGITESGKKVSGKIKAPSESVAKAMLHKKGIRVLHLREVTKTVSFDKVREYRFTDSEILDFLINIKDLIVAGITLTEALNIAKSTAEHEKIKHICAFAYDELKKGNSLTLFLRQLRNFPQDVLSLIAIGEESGSLEESLDVAIELIKMRKDMTKRVKKALLNPAITIVVGILITIGMAIFVMPRFESVFKSFDVSMPAITVAYIKLGDILTHNWLYIIIGIAGLILFNKFYGLETFIDPVQLEKIYFKIPVISGLTKSVNQWLIAEQLYQLQKAGLKLTEAIKQVSSTVSSLAYSKALERIYNEMYKGVDIDIAFSQYTDLFDLTFIIPLKSASASGNFEEAFRRVSTLYRSKVESQLEKITTWLPQIAFFFVSLLVVAMLFAIYSPMLSLMTNMKM
jgi:type IV pilus assembly protein PilC